MPSNDLITQKGSEYNQESFKGGMNLLGDDTRLQPNQYRAGFDLTNRYDALDCVLTSQQDTSIPPGIIQELVTFGNYLVIFVSGTAWYRLYNTVGWTQIADFSMSTSAPRYWSCAIPVADTNYVRIAANSTTAVSDSVFLPSSNGPININVVAGTSEGNLPGLLVQDNINQPQFIFLDSNGYPACRTTQNYQEWMIVYTDATNTVVDEIAIINGLLVSGDQREYVPIGNCMAWVNGILYIVSQDFNSIYRSVNGRPLDFVVDVTNLLATNTTTQKVINSDGQYITIPPFTQIPGGDAISTNYSVGVGDISCIRPLSTGGLFVAASNANFAVTLNQTPNAPTLFGEYLFIRTPLFEATCLSDRAIIDSIGDTRFIDLTGVRSFNAIEQTENEGRNEAFTSNIQAAFGSDTSPIVQNAQLAAAILYNDYEFYAVNTIFGNAICKYDTINECWTSFDLQQTLGKGIKILAKIELSIRQLYAVTEDNLLYVLYVGPDTTTASFRSIGVCSNILYANTNIKMNNPRLETKLLECRAILNNITEDCTCSFTPYVNNRLTQQGIQTKKIKYKTPTTIATGSNLLPDVNTQLMNLLFSTPNCGMGWKINGVFSWTNGSITQFSMNLLDENPMNPLLSQGVAV